MKQQTLMKRKIENISKPALSIVAPAPAPTVVAAGPPLPLDSNPAPQFSPVLPEPAPIRSIPERFPAREELYVPFENKDEVKAAGAVWWPEEKIWIAPAYEGFEELATRFVGVSLIVKFEEKDEVKKMGATFRPHSKTWWGPHGGEAAQVFGLVELKKTSFSDAATLKAMGAKWNPHTKLWYTSRRGLERNPDFTKYI